MLGCIAHGAMEVHMAMLLPTPCCIMRTHCIAISSVCVYAAVYTL